MIDTFVKLNSQVHIRAFHLSEICEIFGKIVIFGIWLYFITQLFIVEVFTIFQRSGTESHNDFLQHSSL